MIPLRTDRRLHHTPWVNFTLIAANLAVFLATRSQIADLQAGMVEGVSFTALLKDHPIFGYHLHPAMPQWHQYFTYQFLHADWMHLLFNMLFLYVFGNNLEDRLGPIAYLCFYLAGGVVAGIGHAMTSDVPVLGASGSVSAVTGAFLALFPLSHVTVLWPFLIITVFECPSMYLILLSFAHDVLYQFAGVGNVAYLAHISGNLYGFTIGMSLLATRLLPRDTSDFLALLDRWNRRRQLRTMAMRGQSPWQADAAATFGNKAITPQQEQVMRLRAAALEALGERRSDEALDAYEELLRVDPDAALPRQAQLDLAAFAMGAGRYATAAAAYEAFRRAYPHDGYNNEVCLILGLIYGRYLGEADRARPLLVHVRERHSDASRRALAEDVLAEIGH